MSFHFFWQKKNNFAPCGTKIAKETIQKRLNPGGGCWICLNHWSWVLSTATMTPFSQAAGL
jgi:hypothetical protein